MSAASARATTSTLGIAGGRAFADCGDPRGGAWQHPRQAGRSLLRRSAVWPQARTGDRLHLYRWQRHRRHAGTSLRDAAAPALPSFTRRKPSTTTSPRTTTARFHLGGDVRRRGVRQHRSRFPCDAGHLCRHRDGATRRVPHRRGGRLAARSVRRPHLVYVPEVAFSVERLLRTISARAAHARAAAWWRYRKASPIPPAGHWPRA